MPVSDPQFFFIDGEAFAFNSIAFSVDGIPRRGFTGVDWEEAIDRVKVAAAIRSGVPFAMTYGKYDVKSLTIEMLPQEKQWLRAYLAQKGGSTSVARVSADLQLQLSENGYVITTTFVGCKFKGNKGSLKEGPEAASTPVDFDCRYIIERDINGVTTLYDPLRDQDAGAGF